MIRLLVLLALLGTSAAAQPDLRVRAVELEVYANGVIVYPGVTSVQAVRFSVFNSGGSAAPATRAGVYLSRDTRFSADDVFLVSVPVEAVPAGQSRSASTFFQPFPDLRVPAGLYTLIAVADDGNEVAETSETNNTDYVPIRLGGTGPGIVNVDFDFNAGATYAGPGAAGVPGRSFWNSATSLGGTVSVGGLTQADGETPSALRVRFTGAGRGRYSIANLLLTDWVGSGGSPLTLSGLDPASAYDLYLYAASPSGGTTFTFGGVSRATAAAGSFYDLTENDTYVVFRGLRPDPQTREIVGTASDGPFNGFQIVRREPLPVAAEVPAASAAAAVLSQPHPNPARGRTALDLRLSAPADVRLDVLDALGRRVAGTAPGLLGAGRHTLGVPTEALPAGAYVVRVRAGAAAFSRPVVVVR